MAKRNIPIAEPLFSGNELSYVKECIASTWVSSGRFVDIFEKKFAKFCKTPAATTTTNGTASLHLALLALGIKKGDEVIVPALTFVATANAVVYVGAKPVFVDVDPQTWTIDVKSIEPKISNKTKAIIPVHLYGHPADMGQINKLAKKYNLFVIEDACEAHGSLYRGSPVGSLSDAGCFSFFGNKVITTGEGGMIVGNKKFIEKVALLKSHAMLEHPHYYHEELGYNYRMTNLQAALGLAQFEKISELLKKKIANAKRYTKNLKNISLLRLPAEKPWAKNTFWLYSIVFEKPGLRDKAISFLAGKGIETRPFFIPMHKLPMYKEAKSYPVSEYLSENGLSLPSSTTLKNADIDYISHQISLFVKKHA